VTNGPFRNRASEGRLRSLGLSAGTLLLGVLMLQGAVGSGEQASMTALPRSGTAARSMPSVFDERLWANMGHESWYAEHGYLSAAPAVSEESSWHVSQLFLPVVAREMPPTPTASPPGDADSDPTASPQWYPQMA